jgi:hypothetical protein
MNSDSSVAIASISNQQININFMGAGQSNVVVKASNAGRSVTETFIVGVYPKIEGNYHVADFEDKELDPNSYWNGSDGSGGYNSSVAYFPNNYNFDYDYFQGWAYSNMANDTTQGYSNQYSAITAAGFDTTSSGGPNYGLTYVSGNSKVKFTDSISRKVKGIYVTNSTYAALSMKYGDGYAKEFGGPDGTDPDWFKLSIWGYKNGSETDTIDFYLADYRFDNHLKDYIVETWQWIDLSNLGEVDSLGFGLSSSDVSQYGINTPAYFCVDNLYMGNMSPKVVNPLSDVTIKENAADTTIDLSNVFTDPDNEDADITKAVKSNSNSSLVEASISNNNLTISPIGASTGETEIVIQGKSDGMSVTDTLSVVVAEATGINSNEALAIELYPNPTNGILSIQSNNSNKLQIAIYNYEGQKVYERNIYKHQEWIDISDISTGSYILRIQQGKEVYTKKIIKQ